MNNKSVLIAITIFLILIIVIALILGIKPAVKSGSFDNINLPKGFKIDVFADIKDGSSLSYPGPNPGPRMMLLKDKVLFVTIPNTGKVVALPDENDDKKADGIVTFIDKLNNPHGIDYYDGWFYIAQVNRVIRVKESENDLHADMNTFEVLIDNLPTGGHFTRTIKIHNNSLFLSIGSSCNVCNEQDERRAAITKCNIDGTGCRVYAKGLRNSVGFVFHPETGVMYATDNGRDMLGDDIPPDEINIIAQL
jgi:glucose/arabinose dehydrogenase